MLKRMLTMVAVLIALSGVMAVAVPATALAAGAACDKPKLMGIFVPWYEYLELGPDPVTGDCSVLNFKILPGGGETSSLPLIGLAVVDDLLRLAGVMSVIFIIVGGVQYATSQGEPDQANKARSTIIQALAGLIIAMFAVAFVSFLGKALTS